MSAWRFAIVVLVVCASRLAHADAYYFDWHCQSTSTGDCGPTGASGTEGPFDSSGACEVAQAQILLRLNGPGNAGTTSGCHASSSGASSSSSSGSVAAQAIRVDRWMLGIVGGRGYDASYANGTSARGSKQLGAQIEVVFGRPRIGLAVFAGAERDDGTAPDATTPVSPMWMIDFGVGLVATPFAFVREPTFELRPELGAYVVDLERVGCDRCTTDGPLGTQMPAESRSAFGGRFRVGLDAYWGAGRTHGLALDALIQVVHLGDANDPLSSAVLTPPRVMLRLSYVSRRLD